MTETYESRTEHGSAILARREPIVYEDGQYARALKAEQLADYERDGFIMLENLFSAEEVAALLGEVHDLSQEGEKRNWNEAIREPGSNKVRSVFRVHSLSEKIGALARDPRLLNVARQILGSETYLHQSRVNFKPGFHGKEFYWHSDFETWHVEDGMPAMRALSCSILLTDNVSSNGPLMLIPGSHRQFIACQGVTPDSHYKESLRKQEYGVPDPLSLELLAEQGGIYQAVAPAGSVVFFDCNVMHGSSSNITPWPRANVFMVYNSVHNTLKTPRYGLAPRPEYIATRDGFEMLLPEQEAKAKSV
ncbi:ectoine hydroxylase [Pusillimonas sp. CC-YST705]|uniref:Ectoine hydroxylase n=1 Tax=Mesopusillimonas faecipullorum TaxID=2755040 RepID=A0ABS8CA06_9BURK|nr:ectoine hydroxylase [Mesopusillimonas faecipullorum]MCB5362866.1 ectoine hydroxylase [Mesopusillimonas faecipullorum]